MGFEPEPVTLHIYDIGTSAGPMVNNFLKPLGTGAFHCGVEVHGWEWSYSDVSNPKDPAMTGIFSCRPRHCEGHRYYETVELGLTRTSELEVVRLLTLLEKGWPISEYDLLSHNCCHFADEFSRRLGVGGIPPGVMSLASAGAAVIQTADIADTTCCRMVALEVVGHCCRADSACVGPRHVEQIPVLLPAGDDKRYNAIEDKLLHPRSKKFAPGGA